MGYWKTTTLYAELSYAGLAKRVESGVVVMVIEKKPVYRSTAAADYVYRRGLATVGGRTVRIRNSTGRGPVKA